MIPDQLQRTARLSVVIREGTLRLFGGNPLPRITDGTIADLILPAYALEDKNERRQWTGERKAPFFPKGTTLWVRVHDDRMPGDCVTLCREVKVWPGVPERVVAAELLEDLQLILRPGKKATVKPCKCKIPALDREVASLNEAYTRISAAFEPSRRSHGGSVFKHVFFESDGHKFHSLDDRRESLQAEYEATAEETCPGQTRPGNQPGTAA